jgi:hypothetical protein
MSFKERILKNVLKERRSKILAEFSIDPIRSIAGLLSMAGVNYTQSGNEFYIVTGKHESVTIKVEKNKK